MLKINLFSSSRINDVGDTLVVENLNEAGGENLKLKFFGLKIEKNFDPKF